MSQVNEELKKTESTTITLNDTDVRKLAKVTTDKSIIKMSDLYGKSASEEVTNYVLYSGSFKSTNSETSSKATTNNFNLVIPKNIIKGTITLNMNGKGGSSLTVPNVGSCSYRDNTASKTVENFNAQTISCTCVAASESYSFPGGGTMNKQATTSVTIKFTGEWGA